MKLNRLTIHNIASFEDAEVDFGSAPISDTDLFLIAGKTGSGKTTILDSICLALYNEVPRLRNTRMQGRVADSQLQGRDGQTDGMAIDDTRQMVRRATGEAYVILTFTGNDRREYEARWGARRARNKVNGKFQKLEWTITSLDDGHVWSKQDDVRGRIRETVGLDFEQFCRTTMLAQGDFARFLNSADDDKADLLEKITGTGIYTSVGKKVFEIHSSWRKRWETEKEKAAVLEREAVIPEEEIAEVRKALETDMTAKKEIEMKIAETARQIEWFARGRSLDGQVEKAKTALLQAEERNVSEEVTSARRFVERWKRTASARKAVANRTHEERELARIGREIEILSGRFRSLKGVIGRLRHRLEENEMECRDLENLVKADEPFAEVYACQQTLSASIADIFRQRKRLADEEVAAEKRKKTLIKLQGDVGNLSKKLEEVSAATAELEKSLDYERLKQEEINPVELMKDLAEVDSVCREVKSLLMLLERHGEIGKERAAMEKRHEERRKELDAEDTRLRELLRSRQEAEAAAEAAARLYDQVKMQSEEWAVQCRASLKVGDVCPVCGQTIKEPFRLEDAISKTVENARIHFDEKRESLKRVTAEYEKGVAAARGARTAFERDSVREKERLDKEERETRSGVMESCVQLGIDTSAEDLAGEALRLGEKMELRKGELLERQRVAEILDKSIKELEKELAKQRRGEASVSSDLGKVRERLAAETAASETSGDIMSRISEDISNHIKTLRSLLLPLYPEEEWIESLQDFDIRLKRETGEYQRRKEKLRKLQESAGKLAENISSLLKTTGDIENSMECWNILEFAECVDPAPDPANAIDEAARILSESARLSGIREAASERLAKARKTVTVFLYENQDITEETLVELSATDDKEEERLGKLADDAAAAVSSARELLAAREEDRTAHVAARPEVDAEATGESLENVAETLRQEVDEVTKRIGERTQIISQNNERSRRLSEIRREVEVIERDMRRWERLSNLIGDHNGKRFRRIAQSFVLGTLVRNANVYLREFSARYELSVQPGSFVVMLEDAWQGFVSRPASTLSGGESFLVSLSLALALSDIGQLATVDTLFIDEGFGTLSGQPLRNAVATLRTLHDRRGRHVGIISHIEELRESIPVRIEVDRPAGTSVSTVRVV